jgi:hypothetical protein
MLAPSLAPTMLAMLGADPAILVADATRAREVLGWSAKG